MAYAYKENIPVVCRGAGTGLAGGATCNVWWDHAFCDAHEQDLSDRQEKNQTITAEPGALLIDIQATLQQDFSAGSGRKTASIGGNVITNAGWYEGSRYGLTRIFVRCIEAVMPDGIINFVSSNVVEEHNGI